MKGEKIPQSLQKLLSPSRAEIVLMPESQGKGSWVGAPAASYSENEDCFYLLTRFRKEGIRGYKIILYRTEDGLNLKKMITLEANSLGARSIERGALQYTGKIWRFYLSYEGLKDKRWKLAVAQKENIPTVRADDFKVILEGDNINVNWVKDPVLFQNMLFVHTKELSGKATYLVEKVKNGWQKTKALSGEHRWDRYCPRITSIIESKDGFFAFYDGASTIKENQEEKLGLAYGKTLKRFKGLTPQGPVIVSPEGSGSIRYAEVKEARQKFYIWYESCSKDWSHQLRFRTVGKGELIRALEEYL